MFDYFMQEEANIFVFYRIPKEFFMNPKYKNMSAEAKILYGLLLDRNSLSIKNNWVDENGYIYIYFSREEAMEMVGVGEEKARKIFGELRAADLIKEVRQGLNKPNIIYVGKFVQVAESKENQWNIEKQGSRTSKNKVPEHRKTRANNTDINNTYKNKKSVHQSIDSYSMEGEDIQGEETDGQTDELHTLFEQAQVDMFESEELKENIKEAIKEAYMQPETRSIIRRVRLEHIDRAIAKFREALEQQTIKNPKRYFFKCLLSAISEYGLDAVVWL